MVISFKEVLGFLSVGLFKQHSQGNDQNLCCKLY